VVSTAVDLDSPARKTRSDAGNARRRRELGRTVVRGVGQTLITFGLVALLFVVYELWVTDVLAARQQDQLSREVEQQWADAPTVSAPRRPRPTPRRRHRSR
jgi:hypothetical protein